MTLCTVNLENMAIVVVTAKSGNGAMQESAPAIDPATGELYAVHITSSASKHRRSLYVDGWL